jgi:hypothetical protein
MSLAELVFSWSALGARSNALLGTQSQHSSEYSPRLHENLQRRSASRFRHCANSSNAGCRFGIDLAMTPDSGPPYVSRMLNTARSAAGDAVSSNTRVPLNNPNGMPPTQVILLGAWMSVTRTANARPGLSLTNTVTFASSSTMPVVRSTELFHRGQHGRSVMIRQIESTGA